MTGDAAADVAGIAARKAALTVLSEVLRKRRPLDVVLDETIPSQLSQRDAGFARAIANETMRRFGQIDALLRSFIAKTPAPHRSGSTLEILMAGACELLFLGVPAHAAVDAANRLAATDTKAVHFKPLINATLRRISREGASVIAQQDAERLNTPDWLWTRWCGTYGEEQTRAIARMHAQPAPLDISSKGAVEASAFGQTALLLPGGTIRLNDARRVDALPGYADGTWWVQDFAASLPARLLGDVRGKRVIDLCAAPGGKTAQLAAAGADVIAVEREPQRAARLKENLERLQLNVTLAEADVLDFTPERPVDFVLLDAPCSATGTIRRHPELPWIKSADDIQLCARTAAELLDAAGRMVAPGGVLVFAVCSLEDEEATQQASDFLRRTDDFRREAIAPAEVFGLNELIDADGDLRTLPSHLAEEGGMDGFYAVRLRRLR
ncbi:MAG: RsmB/NOP family class I SAM-dependent RNA methyltransferase [Rhizomicrobium sp.]